MRASIQSKILLFFALILAISFAVAVVLSVTTQRSNLSNSVKQQLMTNTKLLDLIIRNTMLAGEADIMSSTLESIQSIDDFEEVNIYRIDGSVAFSDVETTENERSLVMRNSGFARALEELVPVSVQLTDRREMEYYFPVLTASECMDCHSEEEGVRAIEYFRISYADDIDRINNSAIVVIVAFVAIALACGFLLIFFTRRIIVKPLAIIRRIISGLKDGDLTQTIEYESGDEIGDLAGVFNDFIGSFRQIVNHLRDVIKKTRRISAGLAESSSKASAALEQIGSSADSMKSRIGTLDSEVSQSNQSANDVKAFISNVTGLIAEQASAISQSSSSIEQMSESVRYIARVAEEKLEIANELQKRALDGESEMSSTTELIGKVTESAKATISITSIIDAIATQTNLLAINAAIEAAHAGRYGKGFAVVAAEVRNLSESSGTSAREMNTTLTGIAQDIGQSEKSISKTSDIFSAIVAQIKEVAISMAELNRSTEELARGSDQVLRALETLQNMSETVNSSSTNMDERIGAIADSMKNLTQISAETKIGMEEISIGIREVYTSAESVSSAGVENSAGVNELEELISRFKISETDD